MDSSMIGEIPVWMSIPHAVGYSCKPAKMSLQHYFLGVPVVYKIQHFYVFLKNANNTRYKSKIYINVIKNYVHSLS